MVSAVKGLLYREFMQYYNSMHWHIGVGFPAFSAAQLCDCHAQWEQEPKGKEHEYAMKSGQSWTKTEVFVAQDDLGFFNISR